MPYKSLSDLPADQTDQYSTGGKMRFLSTFNAVLKHTGSESRAFAAAHGAAKKHHASAHRSKLNRAAGYDGSAK